MPLNLKSVKIADTTKAKLDTRRVAPGISYDWLISDALSDAERYKTLCKEIDRMAVNLREENLEADGVIKHLQQIAYGKQSGS